MRVVLLNRSKRHLSGRHPCRTAMGKRCRWGHQKSSNTSDAKPKTHIDRQMITITVLCVTGVVLLVLLIYCIRRRFDLFSGGDSDSEVSHSELFKPPPTYDEVMGSNNFPAPPQGVLPPVNGGQNVATISNLQMPGPSPPSYDSLSTATTGLSGLTVSADPLQTGNPPAEVGVSHNIQTPETRAAPTLQPATGDATAGQPPTGDATQEQQPAAPAAAPTCEAAPVSQPTTCDSAPEGVCSVTVPETPAESVSPQQQESGSALPV